jgi:tetratricopeptide (TPR) repeat protein
VPIDWAMTQNNLGNALLSLGESENGTAHFEKAVAAYRDALKEYTRERAPLQWAATQSNLGNVLQALGEREGGTVRLDEAVAAYREALMETTRERVLLLWATTIGNQGVTLRLLAERRADLAMAKLALSQITEAFETCGEAQHAPDAAYFEAQLPAAQALVERLRKG